MQSFETVWQTINDKYYDPNFGGLDWSEVHARYKPQITAAQNEEEYYAINYRDMGRIARIICTGFAALARGKKNSIL